MRIRSRRTIATVIAVDPLPSTDPNEEWTDVPYDPTAVRRLLEAKELWQIENVPYSHAVLGRRAYLSCLVDSVDRRHAIPPEAHVFDFSLGWNEPVVLCGVELLTTPFAHEDMIVIVGGASTVGDHDRMRYAQRRRVTRELGGALNDLRRLADMMDEHGEET